MNMAGKLITFGPPSVLYECRNCNTLIGNPYDESLTRREMEFIVRLFPFLFDSEIGSSGSAQISMQVENKDIRKAQKIFSRIINTWPEIPNKKPKRKK